MSEKPAGIGFYLGRFLQIIGVIVFFLAMLEGVNLAMLEGVNSFSDLNNFKERTKSMGRQFLIGMALTVVGSSLTYKRDRELEAGRNIYAKNYIQAGRNVSNVNVAGDNISGHVASNITQMSSSRDYKTRQLADLLHRLQVAIEDERFMRDSEKLEALEQVKILSETKESPSSVKMALRVLKGMATELPTAVAFIEACNKLLPMITSLYGL